MSVTFRGRIVVTELRIKARLTAILDVEKNVVHGMVDKLEVEALADTGTGVSVISDKFRKRLKKLAMLYDEKRLRFVGNNPLRPIGVCTARIPVSDHLVPVFFEILFLVVACSYSWVGHSPRTQCIDIFPNRWAYSFHQFLSVAVGIMKKFVIFRDVFRYDVARRPLHLQEFD